MCMPRSGAGAGLSPRPRLYRRMSVLLSGTPTLPTLLRRIPARFCRRPHLRLRQADTHTLLPAPPTPPAPLAGDTHTLLPAAPPRQRLRDTHTLSAGSPHPARACGAPPPPPLGGGVRAWRYLVGSRIRLFSRISPCCGPCGYRHGGWGRRGGGTRSPSPVSHAPEIPHISSAPPMPSAAGYPYPSAGSPHPASASVGIPTRFCRHPPPRQRLRRDTHTLLPTPPPRQRLWQEIPTRFCRQPHPSRAFAGLPIPFCWHPPPHPRLRRSAPSPAGRGQCSRYQGNSRTRGGADGQPCTGPWGYRVWGRG